MTLHAKMTFVANFSLCKSIFVQFRAFVQFCLRKILSSCNFDPFPKVKLTHSLLRKSHVYVLNYKVI